MITNKIKNSFTTTGQNPDFPANRYWCALTDSSETFYRAIPKVPKSSATLAMNLPTESYLSDSEYDSVLFRDLKQISKPVEGPFAFLPFTYTIGVTGKFRIPLPMIALTPSHQVKFTMYSSNIIGSSTVNVDINGKQQFVFDPITHEVSGIIQSYNLQEENIVTISADGGEGFQGTVVNFTVEFYNYDISEPVLILHDDSLNEAKTQIMSLAFLEEVSNMDVDNSLTVNPTWNDIITFLRTLLPTGGTYYLAG